MNRFLVVILFVAAIFVGLPTASSAQEQESIASWPAFGDSVYLRSDATFKRAMQMLLKKEQAVFSYIQTVNASYTGSVDGDTSMVFIAPANVSTGSVLTVGSTDAKEGQVLFIINKAASAASILGPSSIATCSATTGSALLVHASGSWRMIADE